VMVPHEQGIGRTGFARAGARAQQETDERLRRLAIREETEQFRQQHNVKDVGKTMAALRGQENLVGWAGIFQAIRHPMETLIERPMYKQDLQQGREKQEQTRGVLHQLTMERQQEIDALEKTQHALRSQQWDTVTDAIIGVIDKSETLLMSGRAAERYQFARQANLDQMPEYQARLIMEQYEQKQAEIFGKQTAKRVQGLDFQTTGMVESRQEILDPLNLELRVTNQLAEAQRRYFEEHQEAMPTRLQSAVRINAAQQENLRLVKEGRAAYEQFMLPIERAGMSQAKLKQQWEAGGFGKGPSAEFAFLRANLAAYGQAHKDYMSLVKGTRQEALVSNTGALTWAFYEYQMGKAAIPPGVMEGGLEGKAPGMTELERTNMIGTKEDSTKMITHLKTIADGVTSLAGRRDSGRLAPAMITAPGA